MILRLDDIKEPCAKILSALDTNNLDKLSESLELKVENGALYLNVTNKEYYVRVKIAQVEPQPFHITVNANLFLKLISQTTTETIELIPTVQSLEIKGNGNYNIPAITSEDGEALKLPTIDLVTIVDEFSIEYDILNSIASYNSKELSKGIASRPIQKLYYLDNKGCITFTSGACVNNFELSHPIKILFNNRLVKLFKLFKDDSNIILRHAYDQHDEFTVEKLELTSPSVQISAILPGGDQLMDSFPASVIRDTANHNYNYCAIINKDLLLQTLNRLMLFNQEGNSGSSIYNKFTFEKNMLTIYDSKKVNFENVVYTNSIDNMEGSYEALFDLYDIKNTLETCSEPYLNMYFGDSRALVIARGHIYNVIPECKASE